MGKWHSSLWNYVSSPKAGTCFTYTDPHADLRRTVGQDAQDLSILYTLTPDADVEDEIRGQVKALKSQAQAAVFVGGIQIQALKPDNNTNLQIAANVLFFVGILFNVIGAYYAFLSASFLDTNFNKMKSILADLTSQDLAKVSELPLSPLVKRLINQYRSRKPRASVVQGQSVNMDFRNTPLERLSRSIRRNRNAGHLGTAAIALGFITCPAALLCLALQHVQPIALKITAPTVVGILICLLAIVLMQDRVHRQWESGGSG